MIDSHVHLDAKSYDDSGGTKPLIDSAQNLGVDRFVAPALHLESAQRLRALAIEYPCIYPAAGIHPHEVGQVSLDDLPTQLEKALTLLSVPIIGETGLEGHYDLSPIEIQLASLRDHLAVARTHGVPCIIHCRKTEQILYDELQKVGPHFPVVVHCFTGSWDWAQRFLELGCYIGITGIVTFKSAGDVAEVARRIPLDRLLVETDGPYLAPIPHRGQMNKPEYIPLIVDKIASIREQSAQDIAHATTLNTENFFRLPQPLGVPPVDRNIVG